jgi:hypothetical protein
MINKQDVGFVQNGNEILLPCYADKPLLENALQLCFEKLMKLWIFVMRMFNTDAPNIL